MLWLCEVYVVCSLVSNPSTLIACSIWQRKKGLGTRLYVVESVFAGRLRPVCYQHSGFEMKVALFPGANYQAPGNKAIR